MPGKYKILLVVFLTVVLADQVTKYLAVKHLTTVFDFHQLDTPAKRVKGFFTVKNLDNDPWEMGRVDHRLPPKEVVPLFWNHKYVENPGAAWGLLATVDDRFRVPFFHVVSVAAILFIVLFYRRLEADQRLLSLSLSLVLGGAVGNYIDRLARNYVIDFIDWHWKGRPDMHWPTFNVADAGICVGVALMLAETLFVHRPLPGAELPVPPGSPEAPPPGPTTAEAAQAWLAPPASPADWREPGPSPSAIEVPPAEVGPALPVEPLAVDPGAAEPVAAAPAPGSVPQAGLPEAPAGEPPAASGSPAPIVVGPTPGAEADRAGSVEPAEEVKKPGVYSNGASGGEKPS